MDLQLVYNTFLNRILILLNCLCNKQKETDEAIIPLKNNIVALRKGIFNVTRALVDLTSLPPQVPGFEVNIKNVVIWSIREMRLHGPPPEDIVFNLKIDGRPFFGEYMTPH